MTSRKKEAERLLNYKIYGKRDQKKKIKSDYYKPYKVANYKWKRWKADKELDDYQNGD